MWAMQVGALENVLGAVAKLNISLSRIESRPSVGAEQTYDFFIDFSADDETVTRVVKAIEPLVKQVRVLRSTGTGGSATALVDGTVHSSGSAALDRRGHRL